MRKLFYLFFVFYLGLHANAQNSRFFFEYKFAQDSLVLDSVYTELMYLDINERGSKFYSRDTFVTDSIVQSKIRSQRGQMSMNINGGHFKGRIRDVVEKTYPQFTIDFFSYIGFDRYHTSEQQDKIQWKIFPDTENAGGCNAQKAETRLLGRIWTAWFCKEYPIQDGPYKFHGLPGLIVKIYDADQSHIFELKGIKNLKDEEKWISELEQKSSKKLIKVSRDKFRKAFVEDRNDPMKAWRSSPGGMVSYQVTDASGKPVNMKDIKQSKEDRLKKENNILELDLIKRKAVPQ